MTPSISHTQTGDKAVAATADAEATTTTILLPLPEAGGPGRAKMMETPNVAGLDLSALAPADKEQQQQAAAAEAAGGSVGRTPLEETSDGSAPDVADKEPHLAPPGTYFQRNRPNGGRLLAEGAL